MKTSCAFQRKKMTQTFLSEFGKVDFHDMDCPCVLDELKEIGYFDGEKTRLLRLLWDLKNHSPKELFATSGKNFIRLMLELRSEGWDVVQQRNSDEVGGGSAFTFKLKSRKRRWRND